MAEKRISLKLKAGEGRKAETGERDPIRSRRNEPSDRTRPADGSTRTFASAEKAPINKGKLTLGPKPKPHIVLPGGKR